MLKQLCVGAAAAMVLAAPAQADNLVGPNVTPEFKRCMRPDIDEADRSYCLGDELDRQNAALKAAFDARVAGSSAADRRNMVRAQKAWEAYRDADCDAQSVKSGTSSQGNSWLTCMVRLTAARAAEMPDYGRW